MEDNDGRGDAPLPPIVPTIDAHNGGLHSLPVNKHAFFAELYAPTSAPSAAAPTAAGPRRTEPGPITQPEPEPLWPDRRDEWATIPETQHSQTAPVYVRASSPPATLGDPTISLALRSRGTSARVRKGLVPVIAAVLAIAVVAVLAVAIVGAEDDPSQAGAVQDSGGQAHESSVDAQHPRELLALIPSGFPDGSCLAVAPGEPGVRAQVECGRYPGVGGPQRAVYQRVDDEHGLAALLQSAQVASVVRVCPGRIQSPGPWRRGGTPARRGGVVFCGQRGDQSVMGWTDDEHRVFAMISAGPGGSSPAQLYQWWSANS